MHTTLTELARCVFGDEYAPTPACDSGHDERDFVEGLTFADADAIRAMMNALSPGVADGLLPVWARNLAYRLAVLQRPDDPDLLKEAALSLYLHGPDWDDHAFALEYRAATLRLTRRPG